MLTWARPLVFQRYFFDNTWFEFVWMVSWNHRQVQLHCAAVFDCWLLSPSDFATFVILELGTGYPIMKTVQQDSLCLGTIRSSFDSQSGNQSPPEKVQHKLRSCLVGWFDLCWSTSTGHSETPPRRTRRPRTVNCDRPKAVKHNDKMISVDR